MCRLKKKAFELNFICILKESFILLFPPSKLQYADLAVYVRSSISTLEVAYYYLIKKIKSLELV